MSLSALNPPDAPPAAPTIPEGLGTKLGKIGTAVFFALGVAVYLFDIDIDWEELTLAGLAAVTAWTVIFGRMLQAAAAYTVTGEPEPELDLLDAGDLRVPQGDHTNLDG